MGALRMTKSIGDRIRDAREERGFSASKLARLVDVTPTAVWNWEKNGIKPRSGLLASIAKALGVTSEYLLNGSSSSIASQRPVPTIVAEAESLIAASIGVQADRVKVSFEVLPG